MNIFQSLCRVVALLPMALTIGCQSDNDSLLAPYAAQRELTLQRVTQAYNPDFQWIGGRVAAVGVNKGTKAALDSTLVWLQTAPTNAIGPTTTVGTNTDRQTILALHGIPQDTLVDNTQYTYWIAEKSTYDAGLDSASRSPYSFQDTTITLHVFFTSPLQWGERDPSDPFRERPYVTTSIVRNEKLSGDRYIVSWKPDTVAFRRIGIRKGSFAAFSDLVWHVFLPDSVSDNIRSPLILPVPPAGANVAVEMPSTGFERGQVYFLWMVRSGWREIPPDFGPYSRGYNGITFTPVPR